MKSFGYDAAHILNRIQNELRTSTVRPSTLSNMNISGTSGLIAIKFYLKHHWGGRGFIKFSCRSDQNSGFYCNIQLPYGYNGENGVIAFSRLFMIGSFSYLQVTMSYIRAWMSSKFGGIRPPIRELAALEPLKNAHRLIMGKTTTSHFPAIFHLIIFLLAGNEIRPDLTTDYRVRCP